MRSVNQPPDDPEFIRNPYPFYRTLRAEGDFVLWEDLNMPVAVTHEAVTALMRHPRFGRQPGLGAPQPCRCNFADEDSE